MIIPGFTNTKENGLETLTDEQTGVFRSEQKKHWAH